MTIRRTVLREVVIAAPDAADAFVVDQTTPAGAIEVPRIGTSHPVAVELKLEWYTIAGGAKVYGAGTATCNLVTISPANDGTANVNQVDASAAITLTSNRPRMEPGLVPGDSVSIRVTASAGPGGAETGLRVYARFVADEGSF